jgi:hypothetical protein
MKFIKKFYKVKILFCILIILNITICKDSTGLTQETQNEKNSLLKQNSNNLINKNTPLLRSTLAIASSMHIK